MPVVRLKQKVSASVILADILPCARKDSPSIRPLAPPSRSCFGAEPMPMLCLVWIFSLSSRWISSTEIRQAYLRRAAALARLPPVRPLRADASCSSGSGGSSDGGNYGDCSRDGDTNRNSSRRIGHSVCTKIVTPMMPYYIATHYLGWEVCQLPCSLPRTRAHGKRFCRWVSTGRTCTRLKWLPLGHLRARGRLPATSCAASRRGRLLCLTRRRDAPSRPHALRCCSRPQSHPPSPIRRSGVHHIPGAAPRALPPQQKHVAPNDRPAR